MIKEKKKKIFKKDIGSISYLSGMVSLLDGKEFNFRESKDLYNLVLSFNKESKND